MLTLEEITAVSRPYPSDENYIYFLLFQKKVVYVGQACSFADLWNRLKCHRNGTKVFDTFHYITVTKRRNLNEVEAAYILKYTPYYNKQLPPQVKWIPFGRVLKQTGLTPGRLKKHLRRMQVNPIYLSANRMLPHYYRASELKTAQLPEVA